MSCNYADGLSPYDHKGVLGVAEKFDSAVKVKEKCLILAEYIKEAKHIVVHTGAGISTSAGIPDFRGPNGVWTLEEKGQKPTINVSFTDAKPTKTHMALKHLADEEKIHYVVSQNIDGLHLKSGLRREHLAELHGNMFVEQCNVCKRQFVRSTPAPTVGKKLIGLHCHGSRDNGRPCRGKLHDVILDWEHSLPDDDLDMSDMHSCIADLSICLGTTLQIIPSGNLPLNSVKYGGKLVICNLQPTKHDNKADLVINTYVDDLIEELMKHLDMAIPEYHSDLDPTKFISKDILEWTINRGIINRTKRLFAKKCNGVPKKRVLVKKNPSNLDSSKIKVRRIKNEKKETRIKTPKCSVAIKQEDIKNEVKTESTSIKSEDCDLKLSDRKREADELDKCNGSDAKLENQDDDVKSEKTDTDECEKNAINLILPECV